MGKRSRKKPQYQIDIAKERIEILLGLAEENLEGHPERSRRYVELARKIGMRYNVRLTKEQKRKFCKECNTFLKMGVTAEKRIKDGTIFLKCRKCNKVYRYPFKGDK